MAITETMDIMETMVTMEVTMDTIIITTDMAAIIETETIPELPTVMVIAVLRHISQLELVLQQVVV